MSNTNDNGEAALRRETEACAEDEAARAARRVLNLHEVPTTERTDAANAAFREKLAYWRNNGAPAYHGPRAGRDA